MIADHFGARKVAQLTKLLTQYQNEEGLELALKYSAKSASGLIKLGRKWSVDAGDDLLIALEEMFGEASVKVTYI